LKYIINGTIIFDNGEGTLSHPDTSDVVQLPLPAQRLLLIILESDYEILSRDFLFREVWDKFGLTGSNSNLNQYLSLLRRSMQVFGCEKFVTTLPKIGIKLDEQVNIVKTPDEEMPEPEVAVHYIPEAEYEKKYNPFLRTILPGLMILLLLILAGMWIFKVRNTARDPVFTIHTLKMGCVVHTLKSESEFYSEKVEDQVLMILKENNMSCRKGFNVYFDYYTSGSPQTYGRTMLSLCREGADGINRSCDNIYYSARKDFND
jgi:DNA-binding winged helix-turn-helix (wHTH) protein